MMAAAVQSRISSCKTRASDTRINPWIRFLLLLILRKEEEPKKKREKREDLVVHTGRRKRELDKPTADGLTSISRVGFPKTRQQSDRVFLLMKTDCSRYIHPTYCTLHGDFLSSSYFLSFFFNIKKRSGKSFNCETRIDWQVRF